MPSHTTHNTPALRFPGYTGVWEQQKLSNVASITMGQSPDGSTYSTTPQGHILIQGNADLSHGWVLPRVWTTQVTKTCDAGDIIMSVRAPAGAIGRTQYNAVIGRGVAAIKGNDFIYQSLARMDDIGYWRSLVTGSTFESINSTDLKNAELCVPSLPEQQKIGSFFHHVDDLINLHQRQTQKLTELKQGLLQNMFPREGESVPRLRFPGFTTHWEQRKVSDILDRYDNLRIPVAANLRMKGSTPYYGANGIQDYVDGYTHDGEFILVAEDGANDLKNYPINYVNGRIWVNNHAHVLQAKEILADNRFLSYAMGKADIESVVVGGGRAKLNAEALMNISLHIPSLSEQKQIGSFFRTLDDCIHLHERYVTTLIHLKKGLLQKMFPQD